VILQEKNNIPASSRRRQTMSGRRTSPAAGRMARATLGTQLFIAATLITILVMAALASIITWQRRQTALGTVRDANPYGLQSYDRTLQLIYDIARKRSESLYPVLIRYMSGEPKPTGQVENGMPVFKSSGMPINGDQDLMRSVTGMSAEVYARADKGWTLIASAYQDQQDHAPGQVLAPDARIAQALESGEITHFPGLVGGKWHLITVNPLKDGGKVYGGIVDYLDISAQIDPVLKDLTETKLAEYGQLFVLRPTADRKDWIRVAGTFGKP